MKLQYSDTNGSFLLILFLTVNYDYAESLPQFGSIPGSFWLSRLQQFAKAKYQRSSLEAFKSFSCVERKDQRYPDLSSNCTNYYRCLGGVAYSYACAENKMFDMDHQNCQPVGQVTCEEVPNDTAKCFGQSDGYYPNYADKCGSYYRCENGTLSEEMKCDINSKWDLATKSCTSDRKVFCLPPSCSGLKDGLYPTPKSGCFSYFACKNGYRVDMSCPADRIFDYMKKKCVPQMDSICYESACQGKLNGKHSVKEGHCDTFVDCFNGKLRHIERCKPGYIFDGYSCARKRGFSCAKRTNINDSACDRRPDGAYLTDGPDCRSFHTCRNRQVVGTFRCNRNLSYNGSRCVRDSNFICKYALSIHVCVNKFDGFYTVEKTNCRKFYRCHNFKKLGENTCPGKHSFDGVSCVDPKTFVCHDG